MNMLEFLWNASSVGYLPEKTGNYLSSGNMFYVFPL